MLLRLAPIALLAACGTSGPASPYGTVDGTQLGTPTDPVPQQASSGPYHVTSRIDLTIEAALPAELELAVATLREFSINPAHALIDAATAAGVPAVGAIYNALPGVLTDPLEGWIDDEIAKVKIAGQPVTTYAVDVIALVDTSLTHFDLDSELAIDAASATQRLTLVDLSPTGIDFQAQIGGLAGDLLTASTTVEVGTGGALALGDEPFGLQYGEYAWQGINAASTATFGGDVLVTLEHAVNCPAVAKAVADRCVLGVCVGHESDLQALCTGGLEQVVGMVHDHLAAMALNVLDYTGGTATMVDDDGDGIADRLTAGTWAAALNLGMGLRHTPATFTGAR